MRNVQVIKHGSKFCQLSCAALVLFLCVDFAWSQSADIAAPTPIINNEITARINPLDVGDSRLTRHYYQFSAGLGDLVISVESTSFNGDVDLFIAGGLRPLVKLSIFATSPSGAAATISKSVFFRRQQSILMRVEGRAAGDATAEYRIKFAGPFIAATPRPGSEDIQARSTTTETGSAARPGTRRVNSIGARIEEPPIAAASTEPPPALKPENTSPTDESSATITPAPKPNRPATIRESPASPTTTPRTTTTTPRRSLPRAPPRSSTARRKVPPVTTTPVERRTPTAVRSTVAVDESTPAVASPPAKPQDLVLSARLVIEMRNGAKVERSMSEIRRLTVERGVLIIVGSDGRSERRTMSDVLRIAIE